MSASTGCSAASRLPTSTRVVCTLRPLMPGVWPGQVDELEQAAARPGGGNRRDLTPRSSMATSSPGSISLTIVAPTMSSAAVSLATTQPRGKPAEHQRTEALGVAGRVQGAGVHEDKGECSAAHGAARPSRSPRCWPAVRSAWPAGAARPEANSEVSTSVSGVPQVTRAPGRHRGQFAGADEVAVVAERKAGGRSRAERGLGVLPDRCAGRGVPAVPDRDIAAQRVQH